MSQDIGIQWEPLENTDNLYYKTERTNGMSILHKEIASLKADNWSLKLSLADSLQCSTNLQLVLTNTIQEKYELIEEIRSLHELNKKRQSELSHERDELLVQKRNLLNEIYELKDELNRKHDSMTIISSQSNELKKSLCEAQETINRMGEMFLKLRSMKKCGGNVPLTQ